MLDIEPKDLLIEIGCEELPSKSLQKLQSSFLDSFLKKIKEAELNFDAIKAFAAPRRLAIHVTHLSAAQPTRFEPKKGPPRTVALDKEGKPTIAALKFAETCKVPYETLTFNNDGYLFFEQKVPGLSTEQLIPLLLTDILNTLPINKRMRWGSNDFSFVRPVQWLVILFGDKLIETEIFGIKSDRYTQGHRFHHPHPIRIDMPSNYETLLQKPGYVIADFEKRRSQIHTALLHATKEYNQHSLFDPELLDEVTGLVEWPVILTGEFNNAFLEIPKEALVSSMQVHQKCFPITNSVGKLLSKFLIVSNIQSTDPQTVIDGNNRVMEARLADAAFYYRVDKETPLKERINRLEHIVFQVGLGSLLDKTNRIKTLTEYIAPTIKADLQSASRAAWLSKADLVTLMVGEFPELQGIMGRYYALQDAESDSVAKAIEEHYHPRFSQDSLPNTLEGSAVALADRIDSLTGIFSIGKRPTGDKDPFGLRRQAMAVLRIIIEKKLNLDLKDLFAKANSHFPNAKENQDPSNTVLLDFCFDRLRAWYQEQGITPQVFEAVLAKNPTKPFDFHQRIQAVSGFQKLPEAEALAAANKRVKNILTKSEENIPKDAMVDIALLQEKAEKDLETQLSAKEKEISPLVDASDYTEALKALATLRQPVDQFFTDVMVMSDNEALRNNRLRLLHRLRILFLKIADISLL